ncbi:DnaT-like ssDNA-binding domain-containing protein [Pseudomonas putida]|uniref:DnaT-like ssDNA-binding domain-containing protein n=1 Tax=Pseudomonas putida TaxID=303 RepID=UPI0040468ADC
MDWFRMYGEFATDPKVQMMNEAMQRRLVMLFCLECSNGLETFHVTERETSIAFALRVSDEEIAATKAVFLAKGFINDDWTLRNWSKRQYVSDSSTARVRAHREKKKRESAKPETDVKRSSNAPEQIQNRTDTEETPPPAREDDFDSRVRFAMTADWQPSSKTFQAVLLQMGITQQAFDQDQFLEFRSFWCASPDDHRTQAKWEHALASHLKRNLRQAQAGGNTHANSRTGAGPAQQPGQQRRLSAVDRVEANVAAQRAARGEGTDTPQPWTAGETLDHDDPDLRQ